MSSAAGEDRTEDKDCRTIGIHEPELQLAKPQHVAVLNAAFFCPPVVDVRVSPAHQVAEKDVVAQIHQHRVRTADGLGQDAQVGVTLGSDDGQSRSSRIAWPSAVSTRTRTGAGE